ncbi:MAG: hypothetical protein AAHH96_06365 [Candidatus Symbiodolus clandestinus]
MLVHFSNTGGTDSVNLNDEALKAYIKDAKTAHKSLLSESWQTTKGFTLWTVGTAVPWTYNNLVKPTIIYSAKAAIWAVGTAAPWTYRNLVKPATIWTIGTAAPWTYRNLAKPATIWTIGTAVPWTYRNLVKPATIWSVGTAVPWTYRNLVKPATIWTVGAAVPWTYHQVVPLTEKLYHGVTQAAQSTWKVIQGGSQKVSIAATTLWEGMQRLPQLLKNKVVGYHPLVNQEEPLNSHDSIEKSDTKDKRHIFTRAEVTQAIQAANEHLCQSMATAKTTDRVLSCSVAAKQVDEHHPLANITTVA